MKRFLLAITLLTAACAPPAFADGIIWCSAGTEDLYCTDAFTSLPPVRQDAAAKFEAGGLRDYRFYTHVDKTPTVHTHECPGEKGLGAFYDVGHLHVYLGKNNWMDNEGRIHRCVK